MLSFIHSRSTAGLKWQIHKLVTLNESSIVNLFRQQTEVLKHYIDEFTSWRFGKRGTQPDVTHFGKHTVIASYFVASALDSNLCYRPAKSSLASAECSMHRWLEPLTHPTDVNPVGLYSLPTHAIKSDLDSNKTFLSSYATLWHKRLSHLFK